VPHFPGPRAEDAAVIVLGLSDGVEMTSWQFASAGLSPYSLSDWYRYLNCSYHVPAVGGTDKMCAETAVGAMRTYARVPPGRPLSYASWKDAIRSGDTFVTVGPLLELTVEGQEIGSVIRLPVRGGLVEVGWHVASVIAPVSTIEIVVSGAVRETVEAGGAPGEWRGSCHCRISESSWIALRVRGGTAGSKPVILAHTSATMILIDGRPCFNAEDAASILDQIEDTTAFVRAIATRADEQTMKRILVDLSAAHRRLHNRLHQDGVFHRHAGLVESVGHRHDDPGRGSR
jgi:hypothetical protein